MYGRLRTADAVNPAPNLWAGLLLLVVVYTVLTVSTVYVLRLMLRARPVAAPQERETL